MTSGFVHVYNTHHTSSVCVGERVEDTGRCSQFMDD